MTRQDNVSRGFIGVVSDLADRSGAQGLTLAEIVDSLDERAFGLLLLVLTLPCLVPGLPGAQVIAIGILLLCLQVVMGREEPWLPAWFLRLRVRKAWLDAIAAFAVRRLVFLERLSKPRMAFFADGPGQRIAAVFMSLAAITVMAPITNTIPSVALTLCALGFIQRDGLLTLAGSLLAAAWVLFLAALLGALFFGAGLLLERGQEIFPFLGSLTRFGATPQ